MNELPEYWSGEDQQAVAVAATFPELATVALRVLGRMPQPITQVCGPITTGGCGSHEGNLLRFKLAIVILRKRGHCVFDQIPFQTAMVRIIAERAEKGYCLDLLEEFYGPVFRSGLVTQTFFLPNWQSSTGTNWERELVTALNIASNEFLEEWFNDHLAIQPSS